jgi:TetR/AcrR family transcriptional repressor of nem operon
MVVMPWPKHHKSKTRERILKAAAAAFREHGVPGVRVEEIMAGAGLTHGGFYSHFASKDELLEEALAEAGRQTVERFAGLLESAPSERHFQALIDAYLSDEHAAHPEQGCPVATLGPEVARGGGKARRALAQGVRRRLDWMRGLRPKGPRSQAREDEVIGSLACMIGGMVLARLAGPKDSKAVLAACRAFLHRALDKD